MNNISFVTPPSLDILQAHYYGVAGGIFLVSLLMSSITLLRISHPTF